MEEKKPVPAAGPAGVPQTPQAAPPPKKIYAVGTRERVLLPLAWALGILCVEVLLFSWPGLGMTVLAAAWYAVLFWYGGVEPLARRENRLLLGAVGLLALTFALYSNAWLRGWNGVALAVLAAVQSFGAWGRAEKPWCSPGMLWERLVLLLEGLFCRLGAPFQALGSCRGLSHKKTPYILGGLAVCIPLLVVVVPTLNAADTFFQQVTGDALTWLCLHFSTWIARLVLGLAAAPFLFGALYALRHPKQAKAGEPVKVPALEAAGPVTVLVVMDALYAFFLAVQCAALFGGEAYLARAGISYAEYARSGFFQLVFVAALNLTLVLLCLQLCRRAGRGWGAARVLSTVLVAMSVVMLVSAAWRMSMYVAEYGLSFKRALTYWGMVLLAVFFAAALLKIWRAGFSFFKVLFTVSVAGWLMLNFANVDALVTRYNIARGLEPVAVATAAMEGGRVRLGALPALEELAQDYPREAWLPDFVELGRQQARQEAGCWQSWSVTAQIAAGE